MAVKNNNSVYFLNTYITFRWWHPLSLNYYSYCCPSKCDYEMFHMCLVGSAGLSSISIPWLSTSSWFLWAIGDTLDLDWFRTNLDGRTFLSFLAAYLLQSSDRSKPLKNSTTSKTWEADWQQSRRLEGEWQRDRHWPPPTAQLHWWHPDVSPVLNSISKKSNLSGGPLNQYICWGISFC